MDFMRNTNVNNFDNAMTMCMVCLYKDSCKIYMTNITSNSSTDKEDIEIAVQEVIDCNDFYPIDDTDQDNVEDLYDKQEYRNDYDTYVYEFYNDTGDFDINELVGI